MNTHSIIDFISGFVDVAAEELEAMHSRIHFQSLKKGEYFQQQDEVPQNIAFIITGAVRIFYTDEKGNEHSLSFAFENQPLVAFDSFANQLPSHIACVALEPTNIIYTSHEEFFSFLEMYPKYEILVRNVISQHLIKVGEHARLLRINPVRDRYEQLCKKQPELIQRVPLKHIASYMGMSLETLSRVRAGKL
ncbi:MAG: Crp/Fnr family transcriptional regulator [Sphingobacteriales bacterium JAD_PAG50586_3]|nr:MAG: Crp/Fnr family transcriptional regulator [Sphingobacteriales bacterium JAD_PAG50586_3]